MTREVRKLRFMVAVVVTTIIPFGVVGLVHNAFSQSSDGVDCPDGCGGPVLGPRECNMEGKWEVKKGFTTTIWEVTDKIQQSYKAELVEGGFAPPARASYTGKPGKSLGNFSISFSAVGIWTMLVTPTRDCDGEGVGREIVRNSGGQETVTPVSIKRSAAPAPGKPFSGTVLSSGLTIMRGGKNVMAIHGATVHLIPSKLLANKKFITATKITSEHLRADSPFDEPLEDGIKNHPKMVLSAQTGENGKFKFDNVPKGHYYIHVMPPKEDKKKKIKEDLLHLPGGDKSRVAYKAEHLWAQNDFKIGLSSGKFRRDIKFVGSHACVECHQKQPDWHRTGKHWNRTAHKLGWSVPGKPGGDQDFSRFPNWFRSLEYWKRSDLSTVENLIRAINRNPDEARKDHCPQNRIGTAEEPREAPTVLEFGDYNHNRHKLESTAGFEVRLACDENPQSVQISRVFGNILLWKTVRVVGEVKQEDYFITLSNRRNKTHKNAVVHLPVSFVYGGGVHRQRFVVRVPKKLQETHGARPGHYTILQFNIDGSDTRWNKDRRIWRDYKISYWWDFLNTEKFTDDIIRAPAINKNTIEAECAGCHVTGAARGPSSDSSGAPIQVKIRNLIPDEAGALDLNGDQILDEVNVGCESCHGPGNAHAKAMRADSDSIDHRHIINPKFLSAERSDLICGRCHDRRKGAIADAKTQAVNKIGEFFPAGGRRQTMIREYSKSPFAGPLTEHLWADGIHSSSPRQQYSEHVKSHHYKNDRALVSCSTCHASHGETTFSSWLRHDPQDPNSQLCQSCHSLDSSQHMFDKGHPRMDATLTSCNSCHMVGTSKPGGDSGQYGLFAGRPPFRSLDEETKSAYWEGNLNSHVFDVPTRMNCGVRGKLPAKAMPTPYTDSCGVCHNVRPLQSQQECKVK